jgi:hypothetical protein
MMAELVKLISSLDVFTQQDANNKNITYQLLIRFFAFVDTGEKMRV